MFFYLLCMHAQKCIIVRDESKTQMLSSKKFDSGQNHLLYDCLLNYMSVFERKNEFMNIVEIIHKYVKKHVNGRDRDELIDEIKLLFATDILVRFGLGNFCISLMSLLTDYQYLMYDQWKFLSNYTVCDIRCAAKMGIKSYEESEIVLNKSLGIIGLTYITYVYEILLFQIKHMKWLFKKDSTLENVVWGRTRTNGSIFEVLFENNAYEFTDFSFSFRNALYKDLNLQDAYEYLTKPENYESIVVLVYSQRDILQTIWQKYTYKSIVRQPNVNLYNILLGNPNLCILDAFYFDEFVQKELTMYKGRYKFRNLTKYELICMVEDDVKSGQLARWKHEAATVLQDIRLLNLFIADWMNLCLTELSELTFPRIG